VVVICASSDPVGVVFLSYSPILARISVTLLFEFLKYYIGCRETKDPERHEKCSQDEVKPVRVKLGFKCIALARKLSLSPLAAASCGNIERDVPKVTGSHADKCFA
jgi:hypothetical protein